MIFDCLYMLEKRTEYALKRKEAKKRALAMGITYKDYKRFVSLQKYVSFVNSVNHSFFASV